MRCPVPPNITDLFAKDILLILEKAGYPRFTPMKLITEQTKKTFKISAPSENSLPKIKTIILSE